jgi:hypothetical protein
MGLKTLKIEANGLKRMRPKRSNPLKKPLYDEKNDFFVGFF